MKKLINLTMILGLLFSSAAFAEEIPSTEAPQVALQEIIPPEITDYTHIYTTDDAPVDSSSNDNKNKNLGAELLAGISGTYNYGYERFYYLKFDLQALNVDKKVKSATVNITSVGVTGGGVLGLFKSANDNWTTTSLTYNNADRNCVSASNKAANLLDSITGFVSGTTRGFNVTNFLRSELQGDKIISVVLRETSTQAKPYNPYHTFKTGRAPEVNLRPYLSIQFYEEGDQMISVDDYSFKSYGDDITKTGLVPGETDCSVTIGHNIYNGVAVPVTVIYALCYGTPQDYRINEYKINSNEVLPRGNTQFDATFTVPDAADLGDPNKSFFIKIFVWNSIQQKQVSLPSLRFGSQGLV